LYLLGGHPIRAIPSPNRRINGTIAFPWKIADRPRRREIICRYEETIGRFMGWSVGTRSSPHRNGFGAREKSERLSEPIPDMAQLQATISRTMIKVSQRASHSTPRREWVVNSLTLKKLRVFLSSRGTAISRKPYFSDQMIVSIEPSVLSAV
jgi:hypothetical protein